MSRPRPHRLALPAALGLTALAGSHASATWSILICDTRTKEIAVGSATCLTGFDLRAETPVLLLGRGAITAQSAVDSSGANRARAFAQIARGATPQEILDLLAITDPGHDNRQYGMLDALGNTLTYSGPSNAAWAGGVTGRIEAGEPGPADDIVYAIQGNILTGEPVVTAAEDAVVNTQGDLAEKLMAGMEAAYTFGGDGRCSCDAGPTDCGAPPPDFTKTADVGYMLVGRLGDRDVGASYMPLDSLVGDVLIGDVDADGLVDLVTTPSFGGPLTLRRNVTAGPGDPQIFDPSPISGNLSQTTGAALADANGDGRPDAVLTTSSRGYLVINQGGGSFAAPVDAPVASGVRGGVAGDFDTTTPGDEWALINSGSLRTYALDPAGGFVQIASQPLGATGQAITRTGAGVAVGLANGAIVPFTSDGDGVFSIGDAVSIQAAPNTLHAADLNGDGDDDYVAARSDQLISVVLSLIGDDGYQEFEIDPGAAIRDTAMADFDGDGDADFGALLTFGRSRVWSNDGAGVFSPGQQVRLLEGTRLSTGDVTGDGLPDAVTSAGSVLGVYTNQGAGLADDHRGFAGGDYFLELNVAGQPDAPYPDPVIQMRAEFDAWRAARDGVPDGAQSFFTQFPERVNAFGSDAGPYQIVAHFLDYEGDPVESLDPARFEIIAPPGRPVPLELTDASPTAAPGVWGFTAVPTGAVPVTATRTSPLRSAVLCFIRAVTSCPT